MLPLPIPAVWAISLTDIWDIFLVSKRVLSASSIFSYFSEFGLVECGIVVPLFLFTIYFVTIRATL